MAATALVPISNGFEEIETMTIVDVLRRADIKVTLASHTEGPVTGRSGVTVVADCTLDAAIAQEPHDMLILPGGLPNAYTLRDDSRISALIKETHADGRHLAAICAAPAALAKAGVLAGVPATNYPGVKDDLPAETYQETAVVESGKIITSRGPGTAMAFSLALARILAGPEKAEQVAADLLVDQ